LALGPKFGLHLGLEANGLGLGLATQGLILGLGLELETQALLRDM